VTKFSVFDVHFDISMPLPLWFFVGAGVHECGHALVRRILWSEPVLVSAFSCGRYVQEEDIQPGWWKGSLEARRPDWRSRLFAFGGPAADLSLAFGGWTALSFVADVPGPVGAAVAIVACWMAAVGSIGWIVNMLPFPGCDGYAVLGNRVGVYGSEVTSDLKALARWFRETLGTTGVGRLNYSSCDEAESIGTLAVWESILRSRTLHSDPTEPARSALSSLQFDRLQFARRGAA
jgi:hypothetical protein